MLTAEIPILGLAAYSGAGKTTLLTRLIPLLMLHGLRIGLIKHSHHNFVIDQPGKDSYRLREAGASPVMLISKHRRAIITEFADEREPLLADQLKYFDRTQSDLILIEGFKHEHFPKIEVYRTALNKPLLYPDDPGIEAIATDDPGLTAPSSIALLDLNKPETVADFIFKRFFGEQHA